MMIKKTFISIFCLFSKIILAQTTTIIDIKSIEYEYLKAQPLKLKSSLNFHYQYADQINIINNHLVLINDEAKYVFNLIDLESNKSIGTFVRKGKGPGELVFAHLTKGYRNNDEFIIDIWDYPQKMLKLYHVGEWINDRKNYKVTKEVLTPRKLTEIQKAFLVGATVIGIPGSNEGKLFRWDQTTDEIVYVPFEPLKNVEVYSWQVQFLHNGPLAFNEQNERVVLASQRLGKLEIFNFNLEQIAKIIIKDAPLPKVEKDKSFSLSNFNFFSDVVPTEHGFFALLNFHRFNIFDSYKSDEDIDKAPSNTVLYFNWNGELIIAFRPDVYIVNLAYDKLKNRLVANVANTKNTYAYFDLIGEY